MAASINPITAAKVQDTTGANSYTTPSFTPTAGALICVLVAATGATPTSLSSSAGLTFSTITSSGFNRASKAFIATGTASAVSQTITANFSVSATGCIIEVLELTGLFKTGSSAVRQSNTGNDSSGAFTAAWGSACLTGNPVIIFASNSLGAYSTPSGWTLGDSATYATPTTNAYYYYRASGFTGTSQVVSNSGTVQDTEWLVVEFDASIVYSLSAGAGSIAGTGQTATPKAARRLSAAGGSLSSTGQAATPKYGRKFAAGAGAIAVAGQDATGKYGRKIAAVAGSHVSVGQDAGPYWGRKLAVLAASIQVTGADISYRYNPNLIPGVGAFLATGQNATLRFNKLIGANGGAVSVVGSSATLIYSAATYRVLTVDPGAIVATGQTAALKVARKLSAAGSSHAVTGATASLLRRLKLSAAGSSVASTGQAATPKTARRITAAANAHVTTGQAAAFNKGYKLGAGLADFITAGDDVVFKAERLLVPSAGAIIVSSDPSGLFYALGLYSADAGSHQVSGAPLTMDYVKLRKATSIIRNVQAPDVQRTNRQNPSVDR